MDARPDPMNARDLVGYGAKPPDPQWPGGAVIAVNFNLNIEGGGESSLFNGDDVSEGMLNDIGVPARRGVRVPLVESVFEYGSRRGAWRVLEAFAQASVKISVLGVARALEQSPELARACVAAGHEIVSHGYRWIDYVGVPEAVEREHIRRAVASLTALAGTRPVGWMTGRPGPNTRRLVVEEGGFLYDRDALNDELPYWLHVGHARDPRRLVGVEGFRPVGESLQAPGEDGGILHGHGASRRHEGPHRVAGVADEHDARVRAAAPAIVALTVEDRPQRHAVHRVEHALQIVVEAGEGFKILLARRRDAGFVAVPARERDNADRVDLVAPAGQVIGQAMAIDAPPFGAVGNGEPVKPARRKNGAVGRRADEARRLRGEHIVAHPGANAVGADDDVGLDRGAIGEDEPHCVPCGLQVHELVAECDRARRNAALQHGMQVAAVDVHVGTAKAAFALRVEDDLVHRLARVPGAADVAIRLDAGRDEAVLEAEPAQHLGDVGRENDAGADPREGRRLLVDLHCKTGALQKAGGRQAAETGADDGDPRLPLHQGFTKRRPRGGAGPGAASPVRR